MKEKGAKGKSDAASLEAKKKRRAERRADRMEAERVDAEQSTDAPPRFLPTAQVPTAANMQPHGSVGGPNEPAAEGDQQQLQPPGLTEAQISPLTTLYSVFELQSIDLTIRGQQGTYPEPELDAFVRGIGGGDWERGKEELDKWTADQLHPELEKLRQAMRMRKQQELRERGCHIIPNPNTWAPAMGTNLDALDENVRSVTLPQPQVSPTAEANPTGANQAEVANTEENRIAISQFLTQELHAPPRQEVTPQVVTDPTRLGSLLQHICSDITAQNKALKASGSALLGLTRATEPMLRNFSTLTEQTQELLVDVRQLREYLREELLDQRPRSISGAGQPIIDLPPSGGGAPPGGSDDGAPPFGSDGGTLPTGGGNGSQPMDLEETGAPRGGSRDDDPLAGLSLTEKSIKPAVDLRPGHVWHWERGQWMTYQEPTAFNPGGNVKTYEDRLAEWARNDEAAAAPPHTPATNKVKMHAPQHFTGEGDIDPDMWLMTTETYLASMGVDRAEWGKAAQTLLRGKALTAYGVQAVPLYNRCKQYLTWDQVRGIVLAYKKEDTPTVARFKLARIKQGEQQSVVDYTHTFKELLAQVGADPPARTDLLNYYMAGLRDPHPMSAMGTKWESLEDAQQFHMRREIEGLRIKPTRNPIPPKPNTFKKTAHKKYARLNAISQRPGSVIGRDESTGGRGRGRGGRGGGRGGAGDFSDRQSRPRLDDRVFGMNLTELLADAEGPCPAHPNDTSHTKMMCGAFARIKKSMERAAMAKKPYVPNASMNK